MISRRILTNCRLNGRHSVPAQASYSKSENPVRSLNPPATNLIIGGHFAHRAPSYGLRGGQSLGHRDSRRCDFDALGSIANPPRPFPEESATTYQNPQQWPHPERDREKSQPCRQEEQVSPRLDEFRPVRKSEESGFIFHGIFDFAKWQYWDNLIVEETACDRTGEPGAYSSPSSSSPDALEGGRTSAHTPRLLAAIKSSMVVATALLNSWRACSRAGLRLRLDRNNNR